MAESDRGLLKREGKERKGNKGKERGLDKASRNLSVAFAGPCIQQAILGNWPYSPHTSKLDWLAIH